MKAMELKVWVDGVQRIVCGVTEFTTCQEVVIALAQAIGKVATADAVCFSVLYLHVVEEYSNRKSRILKEP